MRDTQNSDIEHNENSRALTHLRLHTFMRCANKVQKIQINAKMNDNTVLEVQPEECELTDRWMNVQTAETKDMS